MKHDLDKALTSISGILVTPYDSSGDVAPDKLAPIIDRALAAGVHMPVVNGNTDEFYTLTTDEACTMPREDVSMVGGRAPVLDSQQSRLEAFLNKNGLSQMELP
ncbi:dihydrodipicolinate synthase family protein [Nitratireductor luteus]|uniref:dihydrodipicolinate synthase family protein n=1 Tax=Nitratireductor luteus TaxID=2976980 RepID=UPI00223FCA60|nr:dihydrodipicolinate synthase family protein [Nitratireductor luteus]